MTWPRAALLTCSSSSRTGPVEGLIALASHLRTQGIDARFGGDTIRPGEDLGGHLSRAGVPWERELRLSRKVRLRDVFHDASLLSRWVRAGRFDVLHAAFAHDHHLCLWARAGGVRVVRAVQGAADLDGRRRLWPLRKSDGVVTHAAAYRNTLLEQGLDERRVAFVPAAVDALRFTPGRAPHLRERWGVPRDAPLVGIVARMKPGRGHRELLLGFAHALKSVPDAHLALVGRGEEESALRRLAAGLPAGRVVFGGYARGDELVDAYRALDVAVWLHEGSDGACRGVLEALACGVPVVAGNLGSPPELVEEGKSGRVVDPSKPEEIGDAVAQLFRDGRKMGPPARARAEQFTPARSAEAVLQFWRRLRELPPV